MRPQAWQRNFFMLGGMEPRMCTKFHTINFFLGWFLAYIDYILLFLRDIVEDVQSVT